jgi:pyridoxine/pyridoxamine 5'-phosphate oxidase
MATTGKKGNVYQRTLVFRKLDQDRNLLFYTDSRSSKVNQLRENPVAGLLFYNPEIKLQLFIQAEAKVITSGEIYEYHKQRIDGRSMNDYNTSSAPGKRIKNPFSVDRNDELHFALLQLKPKLIEYLKLKPDTNHLRAIFEAKDGEWEKSFLVP